MNLGLGQLAPEPGVDVIPTDIIYPPAPIPSPSDVPFGASPIGIPGSAPGSPSTSPSLFESTLANLLSGWGQTGMAIARAQGGANPTYQQVTPYGSTTVYGGAGAGTPLSVLSPTSSIFSGSGLGIILLVVAGVVLVSAFSGGRR